MPSPRAEIVIMNELSHLERVVGFVDGFAAEHALPEGAVADVQIALDEVLANIVKYAYADAAPHEISVELRLTGESLDIRIEDDGKPFDPLAAPAPDVSSGLEEREPGGLGIYFVRNLMSELAYTRVGNRNRLLLRKRVRDN